MDNLSQGMMSSFSDEVIARVAQEAGVSPEMASKVLTQMAPAMTGAMAKNTKVTGEAQKLATVLDTKHDGSVFDNLQSISGTELEQDGNKILGHVFGNKTEQVEEVIEKEAGTDKKSTMKMMATFAPLILGALGKEKNAAGIGGDALSSVLDMATGALSKDGAKSQGMIMSLLDLDNDGNVMDDVPKLLGYLGVVKKFLGGNNA